VIHTIEDCLEIILGSKKDLKTPFEVSLRDASSFRSIAGQIRRLIPLTDLEHIYLQRKMSENFYTEQFIRYGLDADSYDAVLDKTRNKSEENNQSKYVGIVDELKLLKDKSYRTVPMNSITKGTKGTKGTNDGKGPWISVRFPFKRSILKSLDPIIESINEEKGEFYCFGNQTHYFRYNENTVYKIITAVENEGFEISSLLLEQYKHLEYINQNKDKFLPIVLDGQLNNFHPATEKYLIGTLGLPSVSTVVKYKDRSLLFGVSQIDSCMLNKGLKKVTSLTGKLASRKSTDVLLTPETFSLREVVKSLNELDRNLVLVIVNQETALDSVRYVVNEFKKYINHSEISVMFRLDNSVNARFNNYVKDNDLNSPVDGLTKVVVICKDKLPKPLLKVEWFPDCVLRLGSLRSQLKVDQWVSECDLVIHYDDVATPWTPPNSRKRNIQKI